MGELSIRIGVVLKQQLLKGALHLDPDAIRHQGVGELLGRVLESETIESLGLASSLLVLLSAIELIGAATILGAGAGGVLHVGLLASSVAISLVLGFHYLARWRSWTESRLTVTHGLVERMIGNRTRVAQESRDRWHEEEDQELARYLERSRALDTAHVMLTTFLPRVWFLLAIVGLAPAVVRGDGPDRVAVALGGILLAMLALRRLSTGILALAGARVALDTVSQLFESARTVEPGTLPLTLAVLADGASGGQQTGPLLRADRLHFRHHSRTEPVVRDASLSIRRGERLLLEGPSGAGKSTLASILCGLRVADGGLLALHGIDRQTLGGEEWRRRVAIAPQFHENHLFGATLAFNLLMGSRWPPAREDLRRAEELCRALGLGDLLAKMPAGIQQIVGETGWQLSHGERSRVYMARALLQEPELCVLDESFAALDVLTGQRALKAAIERVGTLVVIP
jgi:ATP-binding cassette subfamily B protein